MPTKETSTNSHTCSDSLAKAKIQSQYQNNLAVWVDKTDV
jgi:hypothetical protein